MDWEEYRNLYFDFRDAINQIEMHLIVGALAFENFPDNLPPEVGEFLSAFIDGMTPMVEGSDVSDVAERDEQPDASFSIEFAGLEGRLAVSILMLAVSSSVAGKDESLTDTLNIKYSRLLGAQALIMLFAYLDAFLTDTLRTICKRQPNVLKRSGKTIDYATLLDFDSREEMQEYLVEQFVLDFGRGSIRKRLNTMKKQFGIDVDLSDEQVEFLIRSENIRHIAVHNGGRVSQEFINRTKDDSLSIGTPITVDSDFFDEVKNVLDRLSNNLFMLVTKKFFDIDENEITGVARYSENDDVND